MPTTLDKWYNWAFKLDWQYCQEQATSKLLHRHADSKFGKMMGRSSEKGNFCTQEMKAPPLAMAVTRLTQAPQSHQNHSQCVSDAMDVDHAGRCPPIKCVNCRKLGCTAKNCREERKIREVGTEGEAEENFPEQSQ